MATLNDFTQMSFHEKLLVLEAIGDDLSHAEGILETHDWHQEILREVTGAPEVNATLIDWDDAEIPLPSADV
jgi:hypothetical protein